MIKKICFIFMFVFLFIILLRGLPGNLKPNGIGKESIQVNVPPFETSMERGRYALIVSIGEYGKFTVDDYADFLKPDLSWYNGHYLSSFPVGVSLLSTPLYLLGKSMGLAQVFSSFTTSIFTLATTLVIYAILRKLEQRTRVAAFASLIYCFATVVLPYSVTISAHPVSAFLLSLSFYLFLKLRTEKSNYWTLAGIWMIYGLNFFIDYPNLAILLPLLIASFIKVTALSYDRDNFEIKIPLVIMYSAISFLLIFGIFTQYNMAHYGKSIAFTNTYNLKLLEFEGYSTKNEDLSNELFVKKSAYSERFSLTRLKTGIGVLLASHDRGLAVYSPILLLSLVGLAISIKRKHMYGLVILAIFIANIIIYGSFDDPWGGWSFGPRYLITSMPLLAVLSGLGFNYFREKGIIAKIAITLLTVWSICMAVLGALTTNAVPPSIEARFMDGVPDNFVYNWNYLLNDGSSSFLYNLYFSSHITPLQYYYSIVSVISLIALYLIWTKTKTKMVSV